MNVASRKVLQKVHPGFIIMEPNMRRSRIRRSCPGTKRVPGQSRLALWCHEQTNRERERERETHTHRHTSRRVPNIVNINKIEKKGTYA